jgi:K+-sensing histidine kinase KdpD
MEPAAPDNTEDWLLPELARPPLIGELEQRIDLALATARASEAAVTKVGGVALDAADQARHAAELAERASRAALEAQAKVEAVAVAPKPPARPARSEAADDSLSSFSERADRLVARLRGLQRIPLAPPIASGGAGRPQPAR